MRWSQWLGATCLAIAGLAPLTAATAPLQLRIGTPEGLPGYSLVGGQLQIEAVPKRRLFQCVEKTLEAQISWEAYPTRRLVQMVVEGKLDMAFPMGFTEERAAQMLESQPAWDNPDLWLSLRPVSAQDKSLRLAARLGSPQQLDHAAGYARMVSTYTYEELGRTLSMGMADVAIVPQSVYEETKAIWPPGTLATPGRPRSSGFYLNLADPRKLAPPLNQAIERCRGAKLASSPSTH